jgi:uncharacterized protein involved in outer membrane biogenesis
MCGKGLFSLTIKKQTFILILAAAIVALFASAWFFVSYTLSRPDAYKEYITNLVGDELNRGIHYDTGKAALNLRTGLTFNFTNVVMTEKDGSPFLSLKGAFFRLSVLRLLKNEFVFSEVILDQPRLSLRRDRAGVLNIADLLEREKKKTTLAFKKITIEKGGVTFLDQAAGGKDLLTSLDHMNCVIHSLFWKNKFQFRISASVIEDENKADLALDGTFEPAPAEKPISESAVQASLRLKGTNLKHYASYLKKPASVEQLEGSLDWETTFSGTLADFTSRGNITLKNVLFYYPGAFPDRQKPQLVHLDYILTCSANSLKLDVTHLAIDRFEANGQLNIHDMDKEDPFLEATAATSTFSMKAMQAYIPWGIIPKNVGNFIQTRIKDGHFRLVEGRLKGRQSQINHIDRPENADVLSLRAEVSRAVFAADPAAPVFHDISGAMALEKRRFALNNIKGHFGNSPFTLEGSISDFALPGPVEYAAQMTLQPARDEVLWLLKKDRFRSFRYEGSSTLLLSGKGTADNFHLTTRWDLTQAAYALEHMMEKPGARNNTITAEILLNREAIDVSSFHYNLPPVQVSGSALYRFSGKRPLSVRIQSNPFQMSEAVRILPVLKEINPRGTCALDVSGRGDLGHPGSMQWLGNVSLADISFKPPGGVRAVTGMTGKAVFKGGKMETTLFKARIGQSDIQGKFRIDDFRKPGLICLFNAQWLRTADLGWQNPEGELNLSDIKGQMTIEDKLIQVDHCSFTLGKSTFNLSGSIRHFTAPEITARVTSPYIRSEDAARLMTLKAPNKENDSSSGMKVNLAVNVDSGTAENIDFQALRALLNFTPGTLKIESLDAGVFDGQIRAKGKVDIRPDGQNHYEANLFADRISLEKLQRMMDIGNGELTGRLSLSGDLSATGHSIKDIQRTAAGTLQLRAEKGVLKKFSVLSKIFSLLNVAQLAKMQLPDMARDGMPYDAITAHTLLQNGVFSSNDFFIAGNAMEISGAGQVDYLQKEIEGIAGIHPLQTLDRLAGKMPVVGWLLLDKQGKILTIYVKISGPWQNPGVKPMPVKSIGKETLGVFRRLFQLPEKLITDTGEVLWGEQQE